MRLNKLSAASYTVFLKRQPLLDVFTLAGLYIIRLLAILIPGLFATSTAVVRLYRSPLILLVLCPVLYYWIARLWLITFRRKMHSDPVLLGLVLLIVMLAGPK